MTYTNHIKANSTPYSKSAKATIYTMIKELATAQEKLRAIDTLSNCLQKIYPEGHKNNIAYLIHRIIEADYLNSELAREVTAYCIEANKGLFVTVK